MFDVKEIRKDFKVLEQKLQGKDLVYFDNAATSLKPNCVIDTINDYYLNYSCNVHRGDYDLAHKVDVAYEESRKKIADFINAKSNEVCFTSGTSMSINMIAYGYGLKHLKEGDEILISEAEHASNILPWYRIQELTKAKVKFIALDEEGRPSLESLKSMMNERVKIVSLAHISNVLGLEIDAKEFAKVVHQYNAIFVLDGAQSVPHMKIDVKDLDCDFLTFSGHKMCGPTGIGVMYGKFEILKDMDAFLFGGGMNTKFDMCGNVGYMLPPTKFEAGTPHIAGALGLAKAIEYLENIGMDNIQKYEEELKAYAMKKLKEVDNIIIYNENARSAIITFNVKNVFSQDEASLLNFNGIAVRSGLHCAKILVDKLKTDSTVRASLYFYNTFEEIDYLVEVLKNGGDFLDAFFS